MSEPVQVYTACQFVTPIICGQNYSQVGNKKLIHLRPNWAEVPNPTSAQLERKLIRTCSQLGHKLYCCEENWQAGQSYSTLQIRKQGNVVPPCLFFKKSLLFLLKKCLLRLLGHRPKSPSNIICDDGSSFILNIIFVISCKNNKGTSEKSQRI